MSWPSVKLSDVLEFHRGITFKPEDKVETFSPSSVVCMRTKNVQEQLDESDIIAVPESFVKRDELYLQEGDLLISSANSWNLVGKVVRIPQLNYRATAGGFISILRPLKQFIDPDYLYRFIGSDEQQHKIRHLGRQTTNISNLDRKRFLDLRIPLPSLSVQKQIAAVLEKADRLRQQNQKMEQELNSLAQSVFLDMFGDPVTNPRGWEKKTVGSLLIGKPKIGTTKPSHEDGVQRVVRVGELGTKKLKYEKCAAITLTGKDYDTYKLEKGDYLLARAIGSFDHLGKASIFYSQKEDYVYDSHVMRLRFDQEVMKSEFFYHFMLTEGGRSIFLKNSARTSVQFNINSKQISSIELPVPPASLQEAYVEILHQINCRLESCQKNKKNFEECFNSLMQRAFKGELDLKDVA